jgi:hypothetical protein
MPRVASPSRSLLASAPGRKFQPLVALPLPILHPKKLTISLTMPTIVFHLRIN